MAHHCQVCVVLQLSWQGCLAWEDTFCFPVSTSRQSKGQRTLFLSLQLTLTYQLCNVADPGGFLLL